MFEELPAAYDQRAHNRLRTIIRRYVLEPFIIVAGMLDRRSAERLF